jgi:hypothetical protein
VIFFFDGMLGLSYFAGLVVPSVQPVRLYEEAFTALHAKLGLPSISPSSIHSVSSVRSRDDDNLENGKPRQHTNKERNRNYKSKDSERGDDSSHDDDDDNELNSLLRQVSEGDETMIRTV